MAREFKLPDLGEGIHEGEIVEVLVSVGDRIQEGDPLLEVETDKAVTAIPSPFTGTIGDIRVKAGDTVHVGDVLVTFEDAEGEEDKEGEAKEKEGGEEKAEKRKEPPKAPEPPKAEDREAEREVEAAEGKPDRKHESRAEAVRGRRDRPPVPASPATRRLAREMGVDLYEVEATGPSGLVTAEDVRRHAQEGPGKAEEAAGAEAREEEGAVAVPGPDLPDFSTWGPVEEEELKSVRRATARQMALAWSQIPHVSNQDLVDVTDLEALRKRKAPDVEAEGGRLTLTVFTLKAVVTALRLFPRFNASIDMKNGRIIAKRYHHIGIAMDTDRGLIVPVIRDADRKSITELAVELNELVSRTREGKIQLEELQGGTFTITNAGAVGGGFFSPIINFPQAAILGMGKARLQPAVRTDADGNPEILPRLQMPMVVSFDHRIADGADAIRFMRVIADCLEDPERLLLSMI
ncbi:MAG: dihydrolipoamide acetyltransferase family protein [Desulfobacterales bacterium]